MLTSLATISLMSSIIFMFLKHPLSMGLLLLIQTICITMITAFFSHNAWYSYILFLMMIGGMLILFMYMTSVASNEKFKFSIKILIIMIMILLASFMIWYLVDIYYFYLTNICMEKMSTNYNFSISMTKFLTFPSNIILFLMIMYLLITLIAVVKLTKSSQGPLRQMN
uniref:NADH-ubiquinone oxidoreductase chain 6 n=1 Tax=Holotrichia oblita TaxID=644536 RepID=A0A7T1HET1_HOLOL|nr:NADH dehydrogenase subunit 6 [Holotrichia oblita]